MNFICLFILLSTSVWGIEKDWVLDPKTSTLIPKYMAVVKVIKGKVLVEDRELAKGSKIYANDLIQTTDKSLLVLDLIDLTTITLGPNSEFRADSWNYRTKNDREAVFSVLKGQWRALIRSKSKTEDQLQIKTPFASMGVRGTELLVNVLKDKEKDVTQVALLEGSIHLQGEGLEKPEDLKPGDYKILTKSLKGLENSTKILSKEEMQVFDQFESPGIPKLLDRVVMKEVEETTTIAENTEAPERSMPIEKNVSWRENLKKLNNLRKLKK